MSEQPIQIEERVRRYSHSMLSVYRACPLKFNLKYEHKLTTIQPESRHDADFGNAWDSGLTALYRTGDTAKALDAFATEYPESKYPAVLPVRSQGKTFSNGLKALVAYAVRWEEEDAHWKVLHVQERDKSGIHDVKLDMIVEDDRDGQIYGVDHKTSASYLSNDYWKYFEPDSQIRTYTDSIKRRFGHCGGFYINAASFKHRSRAYKGEPAGDWFSFARMMFNPNEDCLKLERDNFDYWVEQIEADRAANRWGYDTQSCHMFGRECEYYKLCSAGYTWPRDEELILNYYRQQCPRVLPEGRCQLGLDHEGDCDPTVPVQEDYEVEAEVEEAIQ